MNALSKSKIVSMMGALGLLVAAAGCSDSNVKVVKNGTFNGQQDITIGAVMKERFDGGKWSSSKEGGRIIVTFKGKISKDTHDLAMAICKAHHWFDAEALASDYVLKRNYPDLYLEYQQKLKKMGYAQAKQKLEKLGKEADQLLDHNINYDKSTPEKIRKNIENGKVKIKEFEDKLKQASSKSSKSFCNRELKDWKRFLEENKKYLPVAIKYHPLYKQIDELRDKLNEMGPTVMEEIIQKHFWVVGSETTFKWIVYPDKETFELISGYNKSWKEFNITVQPVMAVLFAREVN